MIGVEKMTLLETLNADIKTAMKARDKEKLSVLRMIKAAIQKEQIHLGHDLNDDEELTVLSREMKQRKDSLTEFENANRQDLADKVSSEIAIVETYMPAQLSDDELTDLVRKAINDLGVTSQKQFGKLMGAVMPQVKGKADGNRVQTVVKQELNKL